MLFLLLPISNLGFLITARADDLAEAFAGTYISYIGGCFGIMFVMLTIYSLCHIRLPRPLRAFFFLITGLLYLTVLTIGHNDIFYQDATLEFHNGIAVVSEKQYGPFHLIFYLLVAVYFFMSLIALIYSYLKKKDVSNTIIYLLFLPVLICTFSFFGGRMITNKIELLPTAYAVAQAFYLMIAYRLGLYDINDSGLVSLVEKGETGFVSFDFKYRYLGSNETAEKFFPPVKALVVDQSIEGKPDMEDTVLKWIHAFEKDNKNNVFHFKNDERAYHINMNYLYDGRRRRGYQLFLTDDTSDYQYIELLDKFNEQLQTEVNEKTESMLKMHNNLILGMATMVESRDNSTGGHIKRTSAGVRILVEEMRAMGDQRLTATFCKNLIQAAPMHDLGKIAVDDAILRKPGRFEPEEFAKMKEHAAEGARIVNAILENVADPAFHKLAVNVAHYHHERWDGSGYPEKLSGEAIPFEARIMAVADVYDALVSKRVYKDSFSFEKANTIIMEGMGSQFDPGLEKVFVAARPKLEAYYKSLNEQDS